MSEIVKAKLQEVCPEQRLSSMYMVEVEDFVKTAFSKIGYTPSKNIEKSIDKAWANSDRTDFLWEFVYKVWGYDS